MINILFSVVYQLCFTTLLLLNILSICGSKKCKKAEPEVANTTKPSSPQPATANPYRSWKGRQKPMATFDDKVEKLSSEASKKSSKTGSVEDTEKTKQQGSSSLKTLEPASPKETNDDVDREKTSSESI